MLWNSRIFGVLRGMRRVRLGQLLVHKFCDLLQLIEIEF
jgi:hypothetical protein